MEVLQETAQRARPKGGGAWPGWQWCGDEGLDHSDSVSDSNRNSNRNSSHDHNSLTTILRTSTTIVVAATPFTLFTLYWLL